MILLINIAGMKSYVSSITRVKWKLYAPTAAWWGGFLERMTKIVMNLLRHVIGMSSVSSEEMETSLRLRVYGERPTAQIICRGGRR